VDSTMFVPGGELRALLKLGWAPAIQTMFDLGVSSMQDLVGGRLGALALAVNQVVLQVSSLVYYAGSGMASATTTLVGQAVGRGDPAEVRLSTRASTLLCVGWTLLTGAAFVLVPHRLAGVYTIDPSVIAATGACFAVSALLQPFDAWESCLSSALCGLGDTRTPMLAGVFWSWVVGAPLTWALAIHLHLGVLGLFLGRAVASAGTAFTVRAVWPARVRRLLARERPETAR
jgi:MATE family multidrug resistance protein